MTLVSLHAPVTEPLRVQIPAGWFSMGSDAGQSVEGPVHRVWVDSFAMAMTQVTIEEYTRFLAVTETMPPPYWGDPDFSRFPQPVVAVSWFDAMAYCAWLSAMTGSHYRLPTEAEWERAARGGAEGMLYPWGNDPPDSRPAYHIRWKTGPDPVGQSQPNAYGLFEMCENVHEWCSDWFAADYYAVSPDQDEPHNSYLGAFANAGWLGGLLFILVVGVTSFVGFRLMFRASPYQRQAQVYFPALLAFFLQAFQIDIDHWRHVFLMLGAVWGLEAARQKWDFRQARARNSPERFQAKAIAGGALSAAPAFADRRSN